MTNSKTNPVQRFLHKMKVEQAIRQLSDPELLHRFAARNDEVAFEALVMRHGGMVLVVGRRVLVNQQDTDDVFQATFLALARKARSVRKGCSLGCWLHGVAHRLALKTRADSLKRRAVETRRAAARPESPQATMNLEEIQPILDEEFARLPERLRAPLVVCYLDGKTRDEAARQLGWSLRAFGKKGDWTSANPRKPAESAVRKGPVPWYVVLG